jgi:hypothetical protein
MPLRGGSGTKSVDGRDEVEDGDMQAPPQAEREPIAASARHGEATMNVGMARLSCAES